MRYSVRRHRYLVITPYQRQLLLSLLTACLLWQVQRAVPCGATLLCAEDLHAFCLEVSSGNYARSSQGQPDMARGGRAATATADAAAAPASMSQGEMEVEQSEQRVRLGLAVR